jgi:hypothetical protein
MSASGGRWSGRWRGLHCGLRAAGADALTLIRLSGSGGGCLASLPGSGFADDAEQFIAHPGGQLSARPSHPVHQLPVFLFRRRSPGFVREQRDEAFPLAGWLPPVGRPSVAVLAAAEEQLERARASADEAEQEAKAARAQADEAERDGTADLGF